MERLLSEYTNFSSIPSCLDTPSLGTILSYLFVNVEVSEDQESYKTQNSCVICDTKLKQGSLSVKSKKKHHCKFCFNAVCGGCSNLKIKSQIGDKKNRVCVGCLNDTVKKYFRIVISPAIEDISNDKKLKKEIREESEYLVLVKDQITRRKQEIIEKKQEINELKAEIKKALKVQEPQKLITLRFDLKNEFDMQATLDWKINENLEMLKRIHKKSEEITKTKEVLIEEQEVKVPEICSEIVLKWDQSDGINIINDQIALLTGLANIYKKDINKIRMEFLRGQRKHCWIF